MILSASFKWDKNKMQLKIEMSLSTVLKLQRLVLKPTNGRNKKQWIHTPACNQYLHREDIFREQ